MTKEPKEEGELVFKITTKVEATKKTPSMVYMTATNNLPRWYSVKKELKEYVDKNKDLKGVIFAEHGFWATEHEIDQLIKAGKIKVEMT